MKAFIVVCVCEFLTWDALVVLGLCSKGCQSATRAERGRRASSPHRQHLQRILSNASNRSFKGLAAAMMQHQHEIIADDSEQSIGIPGMSWGEAMAFERVTVSYPAQVMGRRVAWEYSKDACSSDRSKGCAVALGHGIGSADGVACNVASLIIYLQLHTGIFSFVLNVFVDPLTGQTVDLFWALRMCEQSVTLAPLSDDPISSHPRYFGHLGVIDDADLVKQAVETKLVPTVALRPFTAWIRSFDTWRAAREGLVSLSAAAAAVVSTRGPTAVAPYPKDRVLQHVQHCYLRPIERSVKAVPHPLFTHELKFQQLTTPKGVWQCETGNSAVSATNAVEAWDYNANRLERHINRGWERGLSNLWLDGLFPIGLLLTL